MIDATAGQPQILLDVYGITAVLRGDEPAVIEDLAEDFAHFRTAALSVLPSIQVELHFKSPPYDRVPAREATVYTPRNVSFRENGTTYIDYSGRALAMLHSATGQMHVYSEVRDLLYEVAYLFLLAEFGERFDAQGLHRIHAVGFAVQSFHQNQGALVLLPMGGGKSTLATSLLEEPAVQLLSDDSPLLTREGRLLAFPLRIGILPGSESRYTPDQLRTVHRMEFGPKLLVRHTHFEHRICAEAWPRAVFVGRRTLAERGAIIPCSQLTALRALVPTCVIGLGLFQGMEFVFHRGPGEIFRKLRTAMSRLRNCIALVRRAHTATLVLGRDRAANARMVLEYLNGLSNTKQKSETSKPASFSR